MQSVFKEIIKAAEDSAVEFELFGQCGDFVNIEILKDVVKRVASEYDGAKECTSAECPYNEGKEAPICPAAIGCAGYKEKKQTNGDRIRSMTDEELAEFLCDISDCYLDSCPMYKECNSEDGKLKWLQEESEG